MNRLAVILINLVLFCFSAGSLADESQKGCRNAIGEAAYDEAVVLLDGWRGDARELYAAKLKLNGIISSTPDSAAAHSQLARYYIMNGYIDDQDLAPSALETAERSLDKALRLDPNCAAAYVAAGNLYFLQNRLEDAAAALSKAEQIGTDDPWLALNMGAVLNAQGKSAEAVAYYQKVANSDISNLKAMSTALDGLILYYYGLKDYQKTKEIYRKQIANEPDAGWAYGNYGGFLLCTYDDAEAAVVQFRIALGLMDYDIARSGLAAALHRTAVMVESDQREIRSKLVAEAESLRPGTPAEVVTAFCGRGPAVVAMQEQ